MSLNGDEGLPADEQPLLPTIQNPSPGEKAPAPKHRTVGDEFVDAATRVDGFFFGQAEGDDADEADDPKAALAASALVIKFLVRRIIKTIRRLGRPKRKTVIAVLIGLFVFVLFCVWSIGLAAYLFNFKEFWTSPTWITSEIEGNARDKYGNPTRDGRHVVSLPKPDRNQWDSYAKQGLVQMWYSRSLSNGEEWIKEPDRPFLQELNWGREWGYYPPRFNKWRRKRFGSTEQPCTRIVGDDDDPLTSTITCTTPLDQHLGIEVTGFSKPSLTISYATDTIDPKTVLVTVRSPIRRSYAGAEVNASSNIGGSAMMIKGSGLPGAHAIHIQVPPGSRGLYSLSIRVDSSLNITAGSDTPRVGRLLASATENIDVGPLSAFQLALLSTSGSITARGVQVARRLNLDGREGIIANVSQSYWPKPLTHTFTDIRRAFIRKLAEALYAFVPWWSDAPSRVYGDSKHSSTVLRSNGDIQLTYEQNEDMDGLVELITSRNVVFSAKSKFVSRFRAVTGATAKQRLPPSVVLGVSSEGEVSELAHHKPAKLAFGGRWRPNHVPPRVPPDNPELPRLSGRVATGGESDSFGSLVAAYSSTGTVTFEFGDSPKAFEW